MPSDDPAIVPPAQEPRVLLNEELSRGLKIHTNLAQDVIIIDANKVRLLLQEKYDSLRAQREWTTPVGILLALLVTLVTSDFKPTWGLSGPTWHAAFLISSLLCAGWGVSCVYKAIKLGRVNIIDDIVKELLKQQPGSDVHNT